MNIKNLFKNVLQKIKALEYRFGLIADYVVEYYNGTNEGYTKWESGKCEIWKRVYKNLSATVNWVTPIHYGTFTDHSLTYTMTGFTGFTEPPTTQLTLRSTGGNLISIIANHSAGGQDSTTEVGTYYVFSPSSTSSNACTIMLYAVGKWK